MCSSILPWSMFTSSCISCFTLQFDSSELASESESKQSAITRVYGLIVVIFNRRQRKPVRWLSLNALSDTVLIIRKQADNWVQCLKVNHFTLCSLLINYKSIGKNFLYIFPVQYCANRTPLFFYHFHQLILLSSLPDFLVLSFAFYYHFRSFFPASNC